VAYERVKPIYFIRTYRRSATVNLTGALQGCEYTKNSNNKEMKENMKEERRGKKERNTN
jgi:hypothetical protein